MSGQAGTGIGKCPSDLAVLLPEPICALPRPAGRVHSNAMSDGKSRTSAPLVKQFRLAQVRKLRECEQVAAVCYRVRSGAIEFLLVRTGSGHWTFPKGGVEPGLSHAQAAALEAFEEAGVHGRMEEVPFARYVRRKRRRGTRESAETHSETEVATNAHLCEVLRLVTPQEADRNPTWFAAEKSKKKLLEGRTREFGIELVRVVDSAVARIQRLSHTTAEPDDALQRVQFEASAGSYGREESASFARSIACEAVGVRQAKESLGDPRRKKLAPLGPTLVVNTWTRRVKRLSGGSSPADKKRD